MSTSLQLASIPLALLGSKGYLKQDDLTGVFLNSKGGGNSIEKVLLPRGSYFWLSSRNLSQWQHIQKGPLKCLSDYMEDYTDLSHPIGVIGAYSWILENIPCHLPPNLCWILRLVNEASNPEEDSILNRLQVWFFVQFMFCGMKKKFTKNWLVVDFFSEKRKYLFHNAYLIKRW